MKYEVQLLFNVLWHGHLSELFLQAKLDLRIGEPMQICIHQKDNSPKPVNHRLTSKKGPKVKSDHTTRFPAHDFLYVGLPSQTSTTNNKQVISNFKFDYTCLILRGLRSIRPHQIIHSPRFPIRWFTIPNL